jgi:hypothetical protein
MKNPAMKRHEVVQPQDQSIKLIPLTKGLNTIVMAHRYDELSKFNWCACKSRDGFIAVRRTGGRLLPMHEVICQCPDGMRPDHINGDHLDNRDDNLRPATHQKNMMNRGPQKNNTSGYKGVTYDKNRNQWMAQIKFNKVHTGIGRFNSIIDAARAYDRKAIELFGDFARTNFARSDYD